MITKRQSHRLAFFFHKTLNRKFVFVFHDTLSSCREVAGVIRFVIVFFAKPLAVVHPIIWKNNYPSQEYWATRPRKTLVPPCHPCFSAFNFCGTDVPMLILICNGLACLQISSIGTKSSYVIAMVHLLAETVRMRYI